MKFMVAVVLGLCVMFCANMAMLYVAMDGMDTVEPSYTLVHR